MTARVLVQAPATSANLGSGFDAAGIALDWWDSLEATVAAAPAAMRVGGEQAELVPTGPDNLEDLFGQLGIQFGKQTVLYSAEGRAFAERRSSLFATGGKADVPPVV